MSGVSLGSLFASDGFYWILAAAFWAGVVRGFSGFGSAMIFLPVAGQFMPPVSALTVLTVMDVFGPLLAVPKAFKEARKPDLARLLSAMILVFPFALWLLTRSDPAIFRYLVSAMALCLLASLLFGLRYKGHVHPRMLYGLGACSGLTGGFLGMPGPPVILFYLSGPYSASVVRANTLLLLFTFDIVFLLAITISGQIVPEAVFLGFMMAIPIMIGNILGARVFDPNREGLYRKLAFCIIAISAIQGLPLFD